MNDESEVDFRVMLMLAATGGGGDSVPKKKKNYEDVPPAWVAKSIS